MLRRYIQRAFCSIAMIASASPVMSQTMTLMNTSPATVNNLLNLGTSGINGYVSGTAFTANFSGFNADIGFTGASGIVHGANIAWNVGGITGGAWAPAIGGTPITANYLTAAKGTIMLNLSTSITNFQFLWGSPGFGDTVTLYSAGNQVAQFTGAQVNAASASFGNTIGTTVITNLATTGGVTFDRVAISNPTSNFEFALQTSLATAPTVAGGAIAVASLPSPAPFPMLGATLFGNFTALIGMFFMWKKRKKSKVVSFAH